MLRIGVIGDYQATKETHLATVAAVDHVSRAHGLSVETVWVGTDEVAARGEEPLESFDGLIIAPGSPYRSLDGALRAIEHARTHDVPLLGTCGGFQHVVLEFARKCSASSTGNTRSTSPTPPDCLSPRCRARSPGRP